MFCFKKLEQIRIKNIFQQRKNVYYHVVKARAERVYRYTLVHERLQVV